MGQKIHKRVVEYSVCMHTERSCWWSYGK